MEEPDPEETPIVFTATERNEPEAAGTKKESKRSVGERLRAKKATPRPIMKGEGRKRFGDSFPPNRQPESKRSIVSNCCDDGNKEESLKRNRLSKLEEEAEIRGMQSKLTAGAEKVDGRKIEMGLGQTETSKLNGNNGDQRMKPSNCPSPAENPSTMVPIPTVEGEVSAPNTNKSISQMEQGTILADSRLEIHFGKDEKKQNESNGQGKPNMEGEKSFSNMPPDTIVEENLLSVKETAQHLHSKGILPLKSQKNPRDDVEMAAAKLSHT